eukprot:1639677-Rhodomonas_salina.2
MQVGVVPGRKEQSGEEEKTSRAERAKKVKDEDEEAESARRKSGAGSKGGRASEGGGRAREAKPQPEPDLWEGPVEFVWQKKGGWTLACVSVYNKMLRSKDSWPFERPVDPDALGLADYYEVRIRYPIRVQAIFSSRVLQTRA